MPALTIYPATVTNEINSNKAEYHDSNYRITRGIHKLMFSCIYSSSIKYFVTINILGICSSCSSSSNINSSSNSRNRSRIEVVVFVVVVVEIVEQEPLLM